MRTMTKVLMAVAVAVALVLVAGCGSSDGDPAGGAEDTWLSAHGLDGLDAREVIDRLDAMAVDDRPGDLIASVRADALLLSDDAGNEATLDLPHDEFYVSVAPYRDRTHDCFFHSLTTCLGELRGEDIAVTVTDAATGTTIVDETIRTYDNGFAGLWLPRGIEATLTIEHGEQTVSMPIATTDDEPTCVTTAHLA